MQSNKRFLAAAAVSAAALVLSPRAAQAQYCATHYCLARDVVQLTLTGEAPVARIQCTVSRLPDAAEATVIWDPREQRGPQRTVLLTGSPTAAQSYNLFCQSDTVDLNVSQPGGIERSEIYRYSFPNAAGPGPLQATLLPVATAAAGVPPVVTITLSLPGAADRQRLLAARYDALPTTRLRSLDPTTPLITDALTALAAVALERAEEAGKAHVRTLLSHILCDSLTLEKVRSLRGSALAQILSELPLEETQPLLNHTCNLIKTARLDDLASSGDAVWKALAADVLEIGMLTIRQTLNDGVSSPTRIQLAQATAILEALEATNPTLTINRANISGCVGLGSTAAAVACIAGVDAGRVAGVGDASVGALQEWLVHASRDLVTGSERALLLSAGTKSALEVDVSGERVGLGKVLDLAHKTALSALSGNTATTERDAQAFLLEVGRIGLSGAPQDGVACGLEMGFAILHECLRQGECSADALVRILDEEVQSTSQSPCVGDAVLKKWPELPALLGHAADVLRPAPGTPAKTTAITAVQLVLDVTEHLLSESIQANSTDELVKFVKQGQRPRSCSGKPTVRPATVAGFRGGVGKAQVQQQNIDLEALLEGDVLQTASWQVIEHATTCDPTPGGAPVVEKTHAPLKLIARLRHRQQRARFALSIVKSLRALMDVATGGDAAPAIAEVSRTFSGAVADHCAESRVLDGNSNCSGLPVTSRQIERAFGVLTALTSYATSYRPTKDGQGADLASRRADERKKAMEALVDAVTDRTNRGGEWVFSFGANVGFAVSYVNPQDPQDASRKDLDNGSGQINRTPLRLETGFALDLVPNPTPGRILPSGWGVGFHAQASILDLAQYIASREPTPANSAANNEIEIAKPRVATAAFLGGSLGLLVGPPRYPAVLGAFAGWAPDLEFGSTRSAWMVGGSAGIYVPFIDFN